MTMFNEATWWKGKIADSLIPEKIKPKLPKITESLKDIFKNDDAPSNMVAATKRISQAHDIPIPTATRFMGYVNDAFLKYMEAHPKQKKKVTHVFKLRKKAADEENERVFKKVKIIIRNEDGEEVDPTKWRENFLKNEDMNDFRFSTLINRFRTLEKGSGGKLQSKVGKKGTGSKAEGDEAGLADDSTNVNLKGGGPTRLNANAKTAGISGKASGSGASLDDAGAVEEEGYDYGIIQTIYMNPMGEILEIKEETAKEGDTFVGSNEDQDAEITALRKELQDSNGKLASVLLSMKKAEERGSNAQDELAGLADDELGLQLSEKERERQEQERKEQEERERKKREEEEAAAKKRAEEERQRREAAKRARAAQLASAALANERSRAVDLTAGVEEAMDFKLGGNSSNDRVRPFLVPNLPEAPKTAEKAGLKKNVFAKPGAASSKSGVQGKTRIGASDIPTAFLISDGYFLVMNTDDESVLLSGALDHERNDDDALRSHLRGLKQKDRDAVIAYLKENGYDSALARLNLDGKGGHGALGKGGQTNKSKKKGGGGSKTGDGDEALTAEDLSVEDGLDAMEDDLALYDALRKGVLDANKIKKMKVVKKKKKGSSTDGLDKGGIVDDEYPYVNCEVPESYVERGDDEFDENVDIDADGHFFDAISTAFGDTDDLFEGNDAEAARRAEERKMEGDLLSAAALVEVILTKERKKTQRILGELVEDDPMAFLTRQSKKKGIKGVDEVIQSLVNDLKNTLRTSLTVNHNPKSTEADKHEALKDVSLANLTFMMFFMNRMTAVKIPVLADEELVQMLTQTITETPRGKTMDLVNTLSLLSRIKENHAAFLQHGAIQLFAGLVTKEGIMRNVYLSVVEVFCYVIDDHACKNFILRNTPPNCLPELVKTAHQFIGLDDFCIRYVCGFLYKMAMESQNLKGVVKWGGVDFCLDVMQQWLKLHEDVLRLACGILMYATKDREQVAACVKKKLPKNGLQTAKKHMDDFADSVRYALAVVVNMLNTQEGRKKVGSEVSFVPTLLYICRKYNDVEDFDADVVKYATILLFFFSHSHANLEFLLEENTIPILLEIIKNNLKYSAEVLAAATGVYMQIALYNPKGRELLAKEMSIMGQAIVLLNQYATSQPVLVENTLGFLAGICRIPKNSTLFAGMGGLQATITVLQARMRDSPGVVEHASASLKNMLGNPVHLQTFITTCQGLPLLEEVLKRYLQEQSSSDEYSEGRAKYELWNMEDLVVKKGEKKDEDADDFDDEFEDDVKRPSNVEGTTRNEDVVTCVTELLSFILGQLTPEQRKPIEKSEVLQSVLMQTMTVYTGQNRVICEQCTTCLLALKVSHGSFSTFGKLLKAAKKAHPESSKFDP